MFGSAPGASASGGATAKSSLFKRPAWSKPAETATPADLFSRSKDTYADFVKNAEEQKRVRRERRAAREAARREQSVEEGGRGKRRKVGSEEESGEEEFGVGAPAAPERSPSKSKTPQLLSPVGVEEPRESLSKSYEANVKDSTDPIFNAISLSDDEPAPIEPPASPTNPPPHDDHDPSPALPTADITTLSDSEDDFSELTRRIRERQRLKRLETDAVTTAPNQAPSLNNRAGPQTTPSHSATETHPLGPVITIYVTSQLPHTKHLDFKRRLGARLKEVRQAWCKTHSLDAATAASVFLTWRGRRVFDATSMRSLGITVDEMGTVSAAEKPVEEAWGAEQKVWMQMVTEEMFEAERRAREEERRRGLLGEEVGDESQVDEVQDPPLVEIGLVLKAKGKPDVGMRVNPTTTVAQMISHYRAQRQLADSAPLFLMFDGDKLDPAQTVEQLDLEDEESLEVHFK